MALGNNMKKTFNNSDSLKLQKYNVMNSGAEGKITEISNHLTNESCKSNSMTSKIIEARLLTGTLYL